MNEQYKQVGEVVDQKIAQLIQEGTWPKQPDDDGTPLISQAKRHFEQRVPLIKEIWGETCRELGVHWPVPVSTEQPH